MVLTVNVLELTLRFLFMNILERFSIVGVDVDVDADLGVVDVAGAAARAGDGVGIVVVPFTWTVVDRLATAAFIECVLDCGRLLFLAAGLVTDAKGDICGCGKMFFCV